MQIDKVNIYQVLLPFSADFTHSLRKRSSVKNIVVEVIAEHGKIKGYGEGAPRSYVTGETQESSAKTIKRFVERNNFPWKLNDISQIFDFTHSLSNGKDHNSAICAIETAFLDVLGKQQHKYITQYFPNDFYTNKVYYGATIPLDNKQRIRQLCQLIDKMKINKLRIKMGQNYLQNKEIFETVYSVFGYNYDLRVDINGTGGRDQVLKQMQLIDKYRVKVIEQPVMPDDPDIAYFAEMVQKSGVILMADESVCSLGDVKRILKEGYYKMVNVRLSKCGGFRNSLRIIDYLRQNKVLFQIGCHLGESGILSAAGRALCLLCKDALYYDGSYDEFLLKENITKENVTFGQGGKAGPLVGPGLGVEINIQNLKQLSNPAKTITVLRP